MTRLRCFLLFPLLGPVIAAAAAGTPRLSYLSDPPPLKSLHGSSPGRVLHAPQGDIYQWPGLYFEARFDGSAVFFKVGTGDVILRVSVDGETVATLVKPGPGIYEIGDLARGQHTVRIDTSTESQGAPNVFGGFWYSAPTQPLPIARRKRQIEFVGDSHTVGYGNSSATRDCTPDEVWKRTDNTRAFGPKIARHYGADYQVNAISGRGIVRNYAGGTGDTLPAAYPFVLFDHSARDEDRDWHPQVVVIALGTNDFSTPLNAAEKWHTRDELHADFESTYAKFLASLRARNPRAFMLVWATDMAEGEIEAEAGKVVAQRRAAGDHAIEFVPIHGLEMTGCNWHPSLADDDAIAATLTRIIDARHPQWRAPDAAPATGYR